MSSSAARLVNDTNNPQPPQEPLRDTPKMISTGRGVFGPDGDDSNDRPPGDGLEEDMELTEMAIPPPVRAQDPSQPSLEASEAKINASRHSHGADHEGDRHLGGHLASRYQHQRPDDEEWAAAPVRLGQSLEEEHKPEKITSAQSVLSKHATELYVVSWLIFFSIWGTLARLGVEAITLYPNSPFPSRVLWANLGGSFTLGFLVEDRELFREEWGSPAPDASAAHHGKVKKTIPLYIGLATGFCGSFTSFSSFMRDAFLALTNALESPSQTSPYHTDPTLPPRSGGFSFLALLAILIVHPAISLAALQVGAQLALLVQPLTPTISFRLCRRFLDPAVVVLAFGSWLGAVFLAIWPPGNHVQWQSRAVFPLVFAPPGCLLRYYASKHLNAIVPAFPVGTFAVNMFGTSVLGMAFDLQHASSIGASSAVSCAVLQGIMEGFCGCLTTVSTWVAELQSLRRGHAWRYGLVSVSIGLALMVIIMGSLGWTEGFATPACEG